MQYQKQSSKIPKKITQKVSKFSYYVDTFFPDLFGMNKKSLDNYGKVERPQNLLLTKQGNRGIVYNYFYSECINSAAIDANSILGSVKKLYLNQDVIKINDMSYSRQNLFKQSYLPVYGFFSEIIDFVLITDNKDKSDATQNSKTCPQGKAQLHTNHHSGHNSNDHGKTIKTLSQPKEYWLYVIHNCNSFKPQSEQIKKISWQHFIERYHFTDKNIADPQSLGSIKYELVYSYKQNRSFFSFQQKLTHSFIQSHCKTIGNTLENLQKLQGYLLQKSSQVEANKKIQQDVAFSDEHKRQNKIPAQHFKHYVALKKEIYKFYKELHNLESQDDINKYFYQNLICRYLIAKEYHFQEVKKSVIEYLQWEKKMREKYPSIECFKEIHAEGAYKYIGQDFMGRPIILNKAALVDVNKMKDVDKYCDYYIYFLEIYLRTKMRGYVDQMIVIGDLSNLGSNNFKLAITKRNVADSLKYGPQRQYALITVNVSTFAYTAWTFIKPLLPKKTLHKIEIVGHNKKQIVNTLITRMDISVIPDYLGGQNKLVQQDLKEIKEQQFPKLQKIQSSMSKIGNQLDDLDELESIEIKTAKSQMQTKTTTNGLFNLFESVTKTLGINLGGN